ncbi:hypothetical protein ABIF61_005407 [Bradyrhizobium japonicum]
MASPSWRTSNATWPSWRPAAALLLASIAPVAAAPPASCAGKFVGRWTHTGGNNSTVTADGRATCEDHAFCVKGEHTWTCDGNVFIYTNSVGTWNYTLAPDGRTMSVGTAVATRSGRYRPVRGRAISAALRTSPPAFSASTARRRPRRPQLQPWHPRSPPPAARLRIPQRRPTLGRRADPFRPAWLPPSAATGPQRKALSPWRGSASAAPRCQTRPRPPRTTPPWPETTVSVSRRPGSTGRPARRQRRLPRTAARTRTSGRRSSASRSRDTSSTDRSNK